MKRARVWIGCGMLLLIWAAFAVQAEFSLPGGEPGCEIAALEVGAMEIYSFALSPDGQRAAVGTGDYSIEVWDIPTGREVTTLVGHTDHVYSLAFSPDGRAVASGSGDATIKLWDVVTGDLTRTLIGHTWEVLSVAFSPDGATLASGSLYKAIKLWDVATGDLVRTLIGHSWEVHSVAFSPDGATLASGSLDETVRLWDVATGDLLHTLTGHTEGVTSVAFSPNGVLLASGSVDGTVKLWDVAAELGLEIATLAEHTDGVACVAFSLDGERLAAGYQDAIVKLWDVPTGVEMATMMGHLASLLSVVFGPDGRTLTSGAEDASIKLWNTAIPSPAPTATLLLEVQGISSSSEETAQQEALAHTQGVLERRLANIGGAQIYQTGNRRIEVSVPAARYSDEIPLLVTAIGYMEFRTVVEVGEAPGSSSQLPPPSSSQEILLDRQGRSYLVESATLLDGSSVESVDVAVQQLPLAPLAPRTVVSLRLSLSDDGARLFADILGALADYDIVAIVIDGVVFSAPHIDPSLKMAAAANWHNVRDALSIREMSLEDATFLATVLRNGVLPLPVRVIDAVYPQSVVCPTQQE